MKDIKLFGSIASLAIVSTCHGSISNNYANDFSIAGNPTGVWTYGYQSTLGGTLISHQTSETISDHLIWRTNLESSGLPANFKYTGLGIGTGGLLPGQAAIHPGPGLGEFGVARYSAPSQGELNIVGAFGQGDFGLVSVFIQLNGSTLFSAENVSSTEAFNLSFAVNASDKIDFIVGSAGIINGDTTPLDANLVLTPVPEPATLAIVGVGAGLLIRRKRRSR